jgi:uncharacterized protein YjbJ (UPF0337 family)
LTYPFTPVCNAVSIGYPKGGNAYEKGVVMSDKTDRVTGAVKQKTGEAVGNEKLAASGRRERVKGNAKSGVKKLKDAGKKL